MNQSLTLPYEQYRQVCLPRPAKLHKGLDSWLFRVVGIRHSSAHHRYRLARQALRIEAFASTLSHQSMPQLQTQLETVREPFARQKIHSRELEHALGLLLELSHRCLGLRPYVGQIMGALGLYQGYLVEMATGEGKSLTAAMAAVLAAWTGRPCHLLTVNDYLSQRDADAFQAYYAACGVTVATVQEDMKDEQRRQAYRAGIVYTTGKLLLADFLRDRLKLGMVQHPSRRILQNILQPGGENTQPVLRGIDIAIVDEADSILIDEAVSPLIISSPGQNQIFLQAVQTAGTLVKHFNCPTDYNINEHYREITLTEAGQQKMCQLASELSGIWQAPSRREELLKQALTAHHFYHLDRHYVVRDQKIVIVDEFTGRLMPGRSWGQGLHQAVEIKEGLPMTPPSETVVRMSFQRFFRLFRKLSGMTGTATEATSEFWQIYRLPVLKVPTHRPVRRQQYPTIFCRDASHKWEQICSTIMTIHQTGRPILVGTRNVFDSQQLFQRLQQHGLTAKLLNAIYHEQEADLIAHAGTMGSVMIATNMAGRGTDIKLATDVSKLGGLHVVLTEKHAATRIDRQLAGRSARQGDLGSVQVFVCEDDELLKRFPPGGKGWTGELVKKFVPLSWRIKRSQQRASQVSYVQRKSVLRADQWADESLLFGFRVI